MPPRSVRSFNVALISQTIGADRASKEIVKPSTRSRPGSQSSLNAGTLKGSVTSSSLAPRRQGLASKFSAQSLRDAPSTSVQQVARARSRSDNGVILEVPGAPRIGGITDDEAGIPTSDQLEVLDAPAQRGLGIEHADVSSAMQIDDHKIAELDTDGPEEQEYSYSSRHGSSPSAHDAPVPEAGPEDPENWMVLESAVKRNADVQMSEVRADFNEELDFFDTTMVAEYSEDSA